MLMTYTPLILTIFVVLVYVYLVKVFRLAWNARNYLTYLFDNPEKLNTPFLMVVLKDRDLPSIKEFMAQRSQLLSIFIATIIVNVVVFWFHPYDTLLYPWMGYILTGALIFQNVRTFRVFKHLSDNRRIINNMCTSYYELEQEQENLKNQIGLMSLSFDELVENINSAMKEEEYTNGDEGGDEK